MTDALLRDLRFALRGLRRGGSFAMITVLTLSLGTGTVTAVFAVVSAVLLRPIVPHQERVVRVAKLDARRGNFPHSLSLPEIEAWRERTRSFEVAAAVDHAATGLTAISLGGQAASARLAPVSADFFRVAHDGPPLLGRWFDVSDEQPGSEVAAVVSERFWRRAGADPSFVGRRLTWAGNRSLIVVGVAPAALDYPLGTDVWAPGVRVFDGQAGRFDARKVTFTQFEIVGRLAAGVSLDRARADLDAVHRRVVDEFPSDYQAMQVTVVPLLDAVAGDSRPVLVALFAAAGLVFAIAGVNVAALLLMRAAGRQPEMAVRLALGAGRVRLLRQVAMESLVLGVAGAAGGLAGARALLAIGQWLAPGDVPRIEQAAIDLRVFAFCIAAAFAWVLVLGTAPVWAHRRLAGTARAEHSHRSTRATGGLLLFTTAEIAAAVVVVIAAGLLVRSFVHLQRIDRGVAEDALVVSLLLPESRQRDPRAMLAFYDRLIPEVTSLPGVRSASPVHVRPGSGTLGLSAPMVFEGQTPEQATSNPWSTWEPVLPSYFETLGIPIVRGRGFDAGDRRDGARVAIVSESVARRYWPGQDPVGKRLQFVGSPEWPWVTVVGVAAETRYRELTRTWMTVYFPADQFFYFQPASLVVRTASRPDALAAAVVQRVRDVDPAAAVESAVPMETLLARELSRPRTALTVTGVFAMMAMVLAAVGVYGVLSYDVRQRRRELAVRAAIGATPAAVFTMVVRRALVVGGAGAAAGVVVAAAVTHLLRSLLFEVQPIDPGVFLGSALALLGIALAASAVPALRAAAGNPSAALTAE